MKIQCNVCEVAEANVLCCADEAALCWDCDQKVHSANKLVSKHQRVPLTGSHTQMPKCDICQEAIGYFFCLEDRALLCRKCDVAIHTANSLVSLHQRFLITGVKVDLEATVPGPSPSSGKTLSNEKNSKPGSSLPKRQRTTQVLSIGQSSKNLPVPVSIGGDSSLKPPYADVSATGNISPWQLDEFLGFGDFNQSYDFVDNGSSKADSGKFGSGKFGDSDCSPTVQVADGEFDGDEYIGHVSDTFWAVPQMPSPPTASGISCPKTYQDPSDSAAFVPDICSSTLQSFNHHANSKRRRQF